MSSFTTGHSPAVTPLCGVYYRVPGSLLLQVLDEERDLAAPPPADQDPALDFEHLHRLGYHGRRLLIQLNRPLEPSGELILFYWQVLLGLWDKEEK